MIKDNYTSTGAKFWKHQNQMFNYKNKSGNSIISTHISPTGLCNLNCSYCSVKKRKTQNVIELNVIKDYIDKLITRGLKAVIITGGGEPTLYAQFNELVSWLKYDKKLNVGLITNGTLTDRIEDWKVFSWVRISINKFSGWKEKISIPLGDIDERTVIGCSYINTGELEKDLNDIKYVADKINATYVRVLPNCLLNQEEIMIEHQKIEEIFVRNNVQNLFFHQFKIHKNPAVNVCHQSYFRPYLSEVDGGTVYPCDSVVLNDCVEKFDDKFKLCKSADILDFLDNKILIKFKPCVDCSGCVFSDNIKMLEEWKNDKINLFNHYQNQQFVHEEFV